MTKRGAFCLLVTVLLLGLVVWKAGVHRFVAAFAQPDYVVVALAFAFTPAVILLKAFRWHLLARSQVPGASFRTSLKSYLTGLFLAMVTPLSAGEMARGVYTSASRRVELTGLVFVDKLFDLTAVCLCGCAGLVLLGQPALGIGGAGAILCGWLMAPSAVRWFSSLRLAANRPVIRRVSEALAELKGRLVTACILIAAANFVVYYVQVYVVFQSFGQPIPLRATAAFPVITLSTIIPYAIGGLGIRELTAQELLSLFRSFALGDVLHVAFVSGGSPLGVVNGYTDTPYQDWDAIFALQPVFVFVEAVILEV